MSRNIVVKTFFNAEEYLAFKDQCEQKGLAHSSALRLLGIQWVNATDSSPDG